MHTTSYHVAFWPLDEPAGSTVAGDLTGNGHYGTLSAGVTAGSAGPPTGDGTTSMAFHGADAVTVASMGGLPSGAHPYSLEAWVLPSAGGAAAQGLVGYGNYAATRQAAYLRLAGATGLLHSWRNDDLTATQTAVLTGTWHLATASYDGHSRRLYLDGVPFAADAPASQPNVQLANLALGQTNGTERLVGSLANVAIYPYALTPAQVGRHYALGQHSPAPTPTTGVVQYTYDTAGQLATVLYPDLRRENHSDYDPAGRVTHISLPDYTDYYLAYNGAGQRTELDYPNGGKEYWAYDPAGRPHDTWWAGPGGTVPFTQTATLDAAGQRTVLQDTAGSTAYGYDGAGRLTAASYPDGSTEADGYDQLGDRTVITSTTVLSGTAVTTNSFDAAAQLNTSVVAGGGQPGTTTYGYDGNGNQTGSAGPAGTVVNTFNQQDQLTHVSGPATSETFVYDGQGDRLRAYDQSTAKYQLHTLVQDLRPGGMSGLLSDGAADYGYADFGVGAAPVARMDAGSSQGAYLASDLLGSVRLATNPSDQTLGSGTYDAWGTARPITADAAGQVLLAGLQASAPFGYAGQQYDAGPGTYGMRARQYDPSTGRFQSVDPLLSQTGQPYAYAGDQPTGMIDPSGLSPTDGTDGYVQAHDVFSLGTDNLQRTFRQAVEAAFTGTDPTHGSYTNGSLDGQAYSRDLLAHQPQADMVSFSPYPDLRGGQVAEIYNVVPDYYANNHHNGGVTQDPGPPDSQYALQLGNLRALQGATGSGLRRQWAFIGPKLAACVGQRFVLYLGVDYPAPLGVFSLRPQHPTVGPIPAHADPGPYQGAGPVRYLTVAANGKRYHVFPRLLGAGLIGYSVCEPGSPSWAVDAGPLKLDQSEWRCENPGLYQPPHSSCAFDGLAGVPLCTLDFFLGGSISANARCAPQDEQCHNAALFGVLLGTFPLGWGGAAAHALEEVAVPRALENASIDALRTALDRATTSADKPFVRVIQDGRPYIISTQDARAFLAKVAQCAKCFPAGTLVATPKGEVAIERLRAGDTVLAEDPAKGKAEPEQVEALIVRPSSPLLRLELGDGSTVTVQPDHPFWVDGGPGLRGSGWLAAGQLRPGDRLRTASGADVAVMAVVWNVGEAAVYTLTVATDHTFFVGLAQVLVHNSDCDPLAYRFIGRYSDRDLIKPNLLVLPPGYSWQAHHILQNQWATINLARFGYSKSAAPAVYLVTGMGEPIGGHTVISLFQNTSRDARNRLFGLDGKWVDSLDQELRNIVFDWKAAGYDRSATQQALDAVVKYLQTLSIPYPYKIPSI